MFCRKNGVQAAYRNDQRQEYVNNLAYKHGTGLGTAPWYGVPGTAYDFGGSKSAGPTYHTDASHPTGYGYQASVPQYHSAPAHGHSGGGGYKAGKEGKSAQCGGGQAESYPNVAAPKYPPGVNKAPHSNSHARIADGGYVVAVKGGGGLNKVADKGYGPSVIPDGTNRDKMGHDDLAVPAGYVRGSYEAIGYGYMY